MPSLAGMFRFQDGAGAPGRDMEQVAEILTVRGVAYHRVRFRDPCLDAVALLRAELDDLEQPARALAGQVLLLDGEVYNAAELAREVLPSQWRALGTAAQCLELVRRDPAGAARRLNGSFNLAYYDPVRGELQLISDRLGTRPLYYEVRAGTLTFALEQKAILAARGDRAELDEVGVFQLAAFGHQLGARTAFRDISVLPPGSILTASARGVEVTRYWRPQYGDARAGGMELSYELARCMAEAVRRRLHGRRAPVGIFLSGGLDSRFVAGALGAARGARPVTAFTFGREDSRDVMFAQQLAAALQFQHRTFSYHDRDLTAAVPRVVWRTEASQQFVDGLSIELHRDLHPHARLMFNGHLGDALSGGHLLPELFWLPRRELTRHILRKRITLPRDSLRALCKPSSFDAMYDLLSREVERDLGELQEERPALLYNLWDLTVRQRRYTLTTPAVDRYLFEQLTPFIDNEVVDLFLGMPVSELFGQRLYIRTILQAFPALASIPWARTARAIEASHLVRLARLAGDSVVHKVRRRLRRPTAGGMSHALGGLASPGLQTMARAYVESDAFLDSVFDRAAMTAMVERHFAGQPQFDQMSLLLTLAATSQLFLRDLRQVPPEAEPALPPMPAPELVAVPGVLSVRAGAEAPLSSLD